MGELMNACQHFEPLPGLFAGWIARIVPARRGITLGQLRYYCSHFLSSLFVLELQHTLAVKRKEDKYT